MVIAAAILLLFFPVRKAFNTYTSNLVYNYLSDIVERETNGTYSIEFKSLRYRIFKQQIILENFAYHPKDTNLLLTSNNSDTTKNYFGAQVDRVEINIDDPLDLFLNDNLKIKAVKIASPKVVALNQVPVKKNIKMSELAGNVYKLVTQYLNVFELQNLEVSQAQMQYHLKTEDYFKTFNFNPFSFSITEFKLNKKQDSTAKRRLLFSDNFEMNSGKQEFLLPDNRHKVSFDRFSVSFKEEFLELNNVRIGLVHPSDTGNQTSADVFIPVIRFKNLDFEKAYYDNKIDIGKLLVERPAIRLDIVSNQEKPAVFKNVNETKLDTNLLSLIGEIAVEKVILSQSNCVVQYKGNEASGNFTFKGFNYKCTDLHLDTNDIYRFNLKELQRNFRVHAAEISHQSYTTGLNAEIKDLDYSSLTRVLDLADAVFLPNQKKLKQGLKKHNSRVQLQQINLAQLHLTNFDLYKAIDNKKLQLTSARITQPTLKLLYDTAYVKPDSVVKSGPVLNFALLDTFLTKNVNINKANIQLVDAYKPSKVYGEIQNFELYVNTFNAKQLELNQDYVINFLEKSSFRTGRAYLNLPNKKDNIKWSHFNYSSSRKKLNISHLKFRGYHPNNNTIASVEKLKITRIKPRDLIANKKYELGYVFVENGSFEIQEKQKVKSNSTTSWPTFKVDSLAFKNIDFEHNKQDSLRQRLENLNLNIGKLNLFTDSTNKKVFQFVNANSSSKKGFISIDKNRHYLEFNSLIASTSDSIVQLKNLEITPVIKTKIHSENALIRSSVNTITLNGFSLDKYNVYDHIKATDIEICEPEFRISGMLKTAKPQNRRDILELHKWFSDVTGISKIEYQNLNLEKGLIDVDWHLKDGKKWHIAVPQYYLKSNAFKLDNQQINSDNNLFYAKNYTLTAYQYSQNFPDGKSEITSEKLVYKTGQQYLQALNFKAYLMQYRKTDSSKKMLIEARLPNFEVEGFKPIDLKNNKKLNVKRLHVANPEINITQFHKKTPYVSRELETEEQGKDEVAIKNLLFKELKISDGDITWQFDDTTKEAFKFNHVNLESSDLKYPDAERENLPSFASLELSFGNFKHQVMQDFYNAKVDSVYLSSEANNLSVFGGELEPRYGIFEFAKVAGWEKTRLETKVNRLDVKGFKVRDLLYDNSLNADLILADSLWIRSFKNKNLPMINRNMPLPTAGLRNAGLKINIDSVHLNNGYVMHRQLAQNGVKSGKLIFSDIKGSVANITNDTSVISKERLLTLDAQAKLMGEGQIQARMLFDLSDSNDQFTGIASMDKFDATLLNEYIVPTNFIKIRKGKVNGAEIEFTANDTIGFGKMKLLYKNLHVDFLNPKDPNSNRNMGLLMKTFLANRVVNTQNPHLFITKKGDVYSIRDTGRAIFHYWGRLAMSGVASSTGVQNNRKQLKRIKREIKKLQRDALRRENAIRRREEEEAEQNQNQSGQPYQGN